MDKQWYHTVTQMAKQTPPLRNRTEVRDIILLTEIVHRDRLFTPGNISQMAHNSHHVTQDLPPQKTHRLHTLNIDPQIAESSHPGTQTLKSSENLNPWTEARKQMEMSGHEHRCLWVHRSPVLGPGSKISQRFHTMDYRSPRKSLQPNHSHQGVWIQRVWIHLESSDISHLGHRTKTKQNKTKQKLFRNLLPW